jgi:hypothetical protein
MAAAPIGCRTALAGGILAAAAWAAAAPAMAQQGQAPPNFSDEPGVAWLAVGGGGGGFAPVAGRMPPLGADPAHPYVPNNNREGRQPTDRIADLSNPNLKPWVKEVMRKDIEEVLAGKKIAFTPRSSCMPSGVPGFMAYGGGAFATYFLQTPKVVWIIFSGEQEVRRVYLDVTHSADPKPSWYGESVGRYEGDTLVVDTIGQNTRTLVDPFRTPHTEKLHVVERWRMVDAKQAMEVTVTVDDPDTYYEPWSGVRRYRRVHQDYVERSCAENPQQLVDWHIPVASKPDF